MGTVFIKQEIQEATYRGKFKELFDAIFEKRIK